MKGEKKGLENNKKNTSLHNEKTKCFSPKKGWAKNQATKIKTTYKNASMKEKDTVTKGKELLTNQQITVASV
jgi:hypothetical protein